MKEPARTINKGFSFKRMFYFLNKIAFGSFITSPNPLKQFPAQNLIISEAYLKPICFKEEKCHLYFVAWSIGKLRLCQGRFKTRILVKVDEVPGLVVFLFRKYNQTVTRM